MRTWKTMEMKMTKTMTWMIWKTPRINKKIVEAKMKMIKTMKAMKITTSEGAQAHSKIKKERKTSFGSSVIKTKKNN